MPRGGARNGTQGKGYSNRTDLGGQNVVSPRPSATGQVPIQAAPGQAYDAGAAQKASQAIVPMGGAPTGGAPTGVTQPSAPLTPLDAPHNPDESLFHGMDNVAGGGGSEAMAPNFNTSVTIKATALLNSLGDNVSPQVAKIRDYLNAAAANGASV